MDFFAIINAVLQLSFYNFRQFAAPSKCRLVRPHPAYLPSLRLWSDACISLDLKRKQMDHWQIAPPILAMR